MTRQAINDTPKLKRGAGVSKSSHHLEDLSKFMSVDMTPFHLLAINHSFIKIEGDVKKLNEKFSGYWICQSKSKQTFNINGVTYYGSPYNIRRKHSNRIGDNYRLMLYVFVRGNHSYIVISKPLSINDEKVKFIDVMDMIKGAYQQEERSKYCEESFRIYEQELEQLSIGVTS